MHIEIVGIRIRMLNVTWTLPSLSEDWAAWVGWNSINPRESHSLLYALLSRYPTAPVEPTQMKLTADKGYLIGDTERMFSTEDMRNYGYEVLSATTDVYYHASPRLLTDIEEEHTCHG